MTGVVWLGLGIMAVGWAMMLLGVGIDTSFGPFANLHKLSIASSLINTGIGVAVLGALLRGCELVGASIPGEQPVRPLATSKNSAKAVAGNDFDAMTEAVKGAADGSINGRDGSFNPYWFYGNEVIVALRGNKDALRAFDSVDAARVALGG